MNKIKHFVYAVLSCFENHLSYFHYIYQQDHLIGELKEYQAKGPADADKVSMTVEYLEAAQSLFEFGVLSHIKISDINSTVLQKMEEGFLFFVAWADYCYGEGRKLLIPVHI